MSSSSDNEDEYTNTGSIFGKITENTKKKVSKPKNTLLINSSQNSQESTPIDFNDSIEIENLTPGKRKSDVIEEVIDIETENVTKKKRGPKSKSVVEVEDVIPSQNDSLNDSIDVIEQINAALERNRSGRGRRKSVGRPKNTPKTNISPINTRSKGRGRGRGKTTRRSMRRQNQIQNDHQVIATIELDVDYPILNSNNFISKIDLGEEMTVKVLWKSQFLQKFDICKKEKLEKIFKYYAEKENVSEELLYFSLDDVIVCKNDTPESLNLNVASIIEGGILSTKTHLSSGYKQNTIELKIQWKNLKRPFIYTMNVTDDMSVLMNECAKQMNVSVEKIKLCFDGEVIEPDDTPSSLDLEGGECIDCIEK